MPAALWPQMGSIFIAFALAVASAELHRRLITMSHRLDIAQKRFLRSRNSVNTAAGSAPAMPSPAWIAGSSARRNGFVASSIAMVVGRVNSPASRCLATSPARAFKSALEGSTVSAKRAFAKLYSCPQ